jgi:hypothetical protein
MTHNHLKSIVKIASGFFGAALVISPHNSAIAQSMNSASPISDPSAAMTQVTSVSQLSDVQPTDWAFQALQSLVERYGCIAGYPDGTYKGNRALTRYEFAAGLNACLDRVNELIAAGTTGLATKEDLATLSKLQEEFASELALLRGRVDALEARTTELEANQFSTTTKLVGEAIFAVNDIFGDAVGDFNNTVFNDRVRLELQTSFTGQDLLITRLAAGNVSPFFVEGNPLSPAVGNFGTAEGTLAAAVGGETENDIVLDLLEYFLPLNNSVQLYLAAAGGRSTHYVFSIANPAFYDGDGGTGAISVFGQANPIYRIGGGAGAAVNFAFDAKKRIVLTAGYLATNAALPAEKQGLFDGDYAALGQLTVTPSDNLQIALTYVNAYHTPGNSIFNIGFTDRAFTGTVPANAIHTAFDVPAISNSFGGSAYLKLSPRFIINAFGGYTDLEFPDNDGNGEIWYYGLGLAFPDLFKQGNLGGIIIGAEPYLGSVDIQGFGLGDFDLRNDTSLHIEAFYRYQITDNIAITPGLVWVTAPDQNRDNSDYVIGTFRTTFTF